MATTEAAVPGPGRAISSRNNQRDAQTAPSPQPSSGWSMVWPGAFAGVEQTVAATAEGQQQQKN
eukprot:6916852-Alexandrium_andersonii.AAC.1